jgi:predicted secreted hydrolase
MRQVGNGPAIMLLLFVAIAFPVSTLLADLSDSPGPSRLSQLLGAGNNDGFEKAIDARAFTFPKDHGPHPSFRNEWWYLTGNLDDEDGRRFGFEITFFRFALTPGTPESDSNWRSNQVYIAHFAVTDVDRERFFVAQKYSRDALGLAGAQTEPFHVWIDDWQVVSSTSDITQWQLHAADDEFGIDLSLSPVKHPVLQGIDGLSQKSDEEGNASYYYSITRFETAGTMNIGSDDFAVSGLSWLDREWSSSALSPTQKGWDWFSLQLSDGSDLMFYSIRNTDGSQSVHSAGTWVNESGETGTIGRDEIGIDVTEEWRSPDGGRYPAGWTVRLPKQELTLNIIPVIENQELSTTVRYWEGAVDISGEKAGLPIEGRGYVELTGYAD